MSTAARKARTLYFIGIGVMLASGFQIGITFFTQRYWMAAVGVACAGLGLGCCIVNGRIWQSGYDAEKSAPEEGK